MRYETIILRKIHQASKNNNKATNIKSFWWCKMTPRCKLLHTELTDAVHFTYILQMTQFTPGFHTSLLF